MLRPEDLKRFRFRGLHPEIFLGTASDRYAGWLGQIYTEARYTNRISKRTNRVGGESFEQSVLPVDSVEEYFRHFRVLEIDYTFYAPLLDQDGEPTQNFHVLSSYRDYMKEADHVILKVPQLIFAQRLRRSGRYVENAQYLDAQVFVCQFYQPAQELMGSKLSGFIFEQEYQRKEDRTPARILAKALDDFFQAIPQDGRYHIEFRTESYLTNAVFEVMQKHGVGQVLSHWTWLPPLVKQFSKAGRRFLNSAKQGIIRLMTPRGMRYEQAYAQAHPFDRLSDGMLQPAMVEEAAELMWEGIRQGMQMNVIINNRAGGNAPLIAREIAQRFMAMRPKRTSD